MQKLGKEKDFEISIVELLKDKIVVVCIYRSPDGDFYMFLKKLEVVIQNVQYKKIYKSVIKEAKKKIANDNYVSRSQNKMKSMWHLIKNEVGKSCKGDKKIQLFSGTKRISDLQIVTDMLNNFFVEIVDDLLSQNNKNNKNTQWQKQRINCCPNTIFFHPVTEYEIGCVTNSLRGKLSGGYNEIPEYLVKKCINYVKRPLAHIFNASLSSGTFPDRLKLAIVIPLHKKGQYHDIKNYRPISILSIFSKILEKLMYNRLMPFLI